MIVTKNSSRLRYVLFDAMVDVPVPPIRKTTVRCFATEAPHHDPFPPHRRLFSDTTHFKNPPQTWMQGTIK